MPLVRTLDPGARHPRAEAADCYRWSVVRVLAIRLGGQSSGLAIRPRRTRGRGTSRDARSNPMNADPLARLCLERALLSLDRRTAGRTPTRAERRLRDHYERQLGALHDSNGTIP